MANSRENWLALASLALQWTAEDEEEAERERRRRGRSCGSSNDPDSDLSPGPGHSPADAPSNDGTRGPDSNANDRSQGLSGAEHIQVDFVEMLHSRNEKRRVRHVETLRRQKDTEEEEEGEGGGVRVELLGDIEWEEEENGPPTYTPAKPTPTPTDTPLSPATTTTTTTNRQHEDEESLGRDTSPTPPPTPSRKFVSSVSISMSPSPSERSGHTTPMSPFSPMAPMSPREQWSSPCQSPSPSGAQSPLQNGHTQEARVNDSPTSGSVNLEQTPRPAFARQSSRTTSFRMLRKKETENLPLQRSSSVRMASKKFESNTEQSQDEDNTGPFQRTSKQRMSSRSIQEKMERLAQAAQKSEFLRSPDMTQRNVFLLDEVSRKRGLFEKELQAETPLSPGVPRQEFRNFASGMSDRINKWLNKTNRPGSSSHSPTDLRHVDITSKKSLFESKEEDDMPKTSPGKI